MAVEDIMTATLAEEVGMVVKGMFTLRVPHFFGVPPSAPSSMWTAPGTDFKKAANHRRSGSIFPLCKFDFDFSL